MRNKGMLAQQKTKTITQHFNMIRPQDKDNIYFSDNDQTVIAPIEKHYDINQNNKLQQSSISQKSQAKKPKKLLKNRVKQYFQDGLEVLDFPNIYEQDSITFDNFPQGQQTFLQDSEKDEQFNDFSFDLYSDGQKMPIKFYDLQKFKDNKQSKQQIAKKTKYQKVKRQRKVRQTITTEKLQKLNQYLKQYFQNRHTNKKLILSLRQIAKSLNLSYSTILHKASVFRRNKQIKPGKLLLSHIKKRKYKKSYQCQKYIQLALKQRPFYTAQALAIYIMRKYKISYPRAIISRHLKQMGFSSRSTKNNILQKNNPATIHLRKLYAQIIQPFLSYPQLIIYIDEIVLSKNHFRTQTTYLPQDLKKQKMQIQDDYISVMIATSCEKIHFHNVKNGFYQKIEFLQVIKILYQKTQKLIRNFKSHKICLVNDLHPIHYDQQKDQSDLSINQTLQKCAFRRIFLPPASLQLNPIEAIASLLKQRLLAQKSYIVNMDRFKEKVITVMKTILSESTKKFFQDYQKWLQRAKNGIPF